MLDHPALLGLLEALAAELDSIGVRGEMFIVGGAAMALAYNTRRSTRDIDAVFEPKATIYQAAERVAAAHGVDGPVMEVLGLLSRGGKHPLLSGEPGVGKSALVNQLRPIVRARDFLPQIHRRKRWSWQRAHAGVQLPTPPQQSRLLSALKPILDVPLVAALTFDAGQVTAIGTDGRPEAGARALPDGEIAAGTPIPALVPLPTYLGALGMTGLTAYFGLLDVGRPQSVALIFDKPTLRTQVSFATGIAELDQVVALARHAADTFRGYVDLVHRKAYEFENGKRTEIDSLNGYVARRGHELGVPTPVNRTLVACVKGIEAWHREQPGAVAAAPSAAPKQPMVPVLCQ